MIFTTDSYFHIGQTHINGGKPCQDYALSDIQNDSAFCIVSDGCSSGGHTDVGARILALSTATAIRGHCNTFSAALGHEVPQEIAVHQKVMTAGLRELLGLDQQDMLATCLYQYITPYGGLVHLQGDGVIAYKSLSGRIVMCRYEWANGMPVYPAYSIDGYDSFIQAHGGDIEEKRLIKQCWEYTPEGETNQILEETLTLGEGIYGITQLIDTKELETLDCIAIFSDGVTQIEGIEWKDAVIRLLAFKTTQGEFAKRRMIRVIKEAQVQKDGRGPIDDISYAVIRITYPQEGDAE